MAHVIYNENMELILEGENLDLILGPNWAKILDIVCVFWKNMDKKQDYILIAHSIRFGNTLF